MAGKGDQMSEPMSLPVSMDAERFVLGSILLFGAWQE
jgi:hypothetical protein